MTVPEGFSALPGISLLRKLRSRGELLLQDRQQKLGPESDLWTPSTVLFL